MNVIKTALGLLPQLFLNKPLKTCIGILMLVVNSLKELASGQSSETAVTRATVKQVYPLLPDHVRVTATEDEVLAAVIAVKQAYLACVALVTK